MNLYDLSDEELDTLRIEVLTEQERRVIVATAQEQIAALEALYRKATRDGNDAPTPTTFKVSAAGSGR